jgi:arsenite methyltransferase
MNDNDVKQLVRDHCGQQARRVLSGTTPGGTGDAVSSDLYGGADAAAVPAEALEASLGCGTPAALTQLKPGEVVPGLGSGSGTGVVLSARRAGPSGKAYGLELTGVMVTLAEENKARSGLANVEFLRCEIENIRFRTPRPGPSPTAAAAGTPERTYTDAR